MIKMMKEIEISGSSVALFRKSYQTTICCLISNYSVVNDIEKRLNKTQVRLIKMNESESYDEVTKPLRCLAKSLSAAGVEKSVMGA